jgi:hypothetical protein
MVAFLGVSGYVSAADQLNPAWFGTWRLDTAKSTASPGPMAKSQTVRIERRGDGFVVTVDSENANGTKSHTMRQAALDGKQVPVTGGANAAAKEAYTRIDNRSFQRVVIINGQVTNTLKATLSRDGKTFTTVTTGTNAEGKPVHNTGVLEKQ